MIYYALAMAATLILCYYHTTTYSLANGAVAKSFSSLKATFIVLLPLLFILAFRWNVGADSLYKSSYWEAYHASMDSVNSRDFELGFFWFMRLLAVLELPYFWFLFVHALLFMSFIIYAFYKGSVSTGWSILVFFLLAVYFDCFSSLRQSLAEALSLVAWANMGYIKKTRQKDLGIVLLFLIASMFHSTALINIPVYLISRLHFSRDGLLKISIYSILAYPVLQALLRFSMKLISGDAYTFMGVARINAIMTFIIASVCWYFYDEISALDDNAYMYVNQAILIFILILNSGAMYLPFRVFDMLKIGYIFIIPYLLRAIPNKRFRLLGQCTALLIFGAWFFNFFYLQDSFVANYQMVFSDWQTIIHLP